MCKQSRARVIASYGGYTFTLLAVVAGKDIMDMPYYSESMEDEQTYAVVAIQNADGSPMPSTQDANYGQELLFISPLVKGLQPWFINAVTMNGGYRKQRQIPTTKAATPRKSRKQRLPPF